MTLYSSLLSTCPHIRKRKGKLVASSNLYFQLLTLGTVYRHVTVDPKEEVVRVRRRYGWVFTRGWKVPFSSIEAVTYGYWGTGGSSGWPFAYDTVDSFSVGLRLKNQQEWHLFYFY